MQAVLVEPLAGSAAVTAEPITPHLGAELRGVTLSAAPDPAILAAIPAALAHHLVLVVDNQALTPANLRDFVAQFGPQFRHHDDEGIRAAGVPEVLLLLKEPGGERLFGGGDWHADAAFRKPNDFTGQRRLLIRCRSIEG